MNHSVGERLRAAREGKNLSLEQVSKATFIKLRFLEALEEDRLEEMHTAAQARGFLRMYADLLDIQPQPLLDIWDGNVLLDEPPAEITEELPLANGEESETIAIYLPDEPSDAPQVDIMEEPSSTGTSAEKFQIIGQILKKRREDLRITHDDVEKFVHIRPKYLKALEEGNIDDLPSSVQGRGMLTNYAHFLEVDNARLQLLFAEGLQQRRVEISLPAPAAEKRKTLIRPSKPVHPQDGAPRKPPFIKTFITPDLLISVPLIIILLGFSFWAVYEVLSRRGAVPEIQAPDISSVLLETATPDALITAEVMLEPTSALAQEATLQASEMQQEEKDEVVEPVAAGNMPLNLNIVARRNAWLKVTVGKSVVFNGRVISGNAYPFSGNERIEFITGNAAALQVFYNGTDLGSLGLNGQVANMIFTLDGIITPTPRFSPTPTLTVQPTATLQPTATQVPATMTPLIP
jgi:cytoskeletal protein RodZ